MPAHELPCPATAAKRCREGPGWADEGEDGCEGRRSKLSGSLGTLRHTHRVIPAVGLNEQGKQDVQGLWPMHRLLVQGYMQALTMAINAGGGLGSEFEMAAFHKRLIQLEAMLRAGQRAQAEAKIAKLMAQLNEVQGTVAQLYMNYEGSTHCVPHQPVMCNEVSVDSTGSPDTTDTPDTPESLKNPESPENPQNPDSPRTPTDQPTKPPKLAELRALAEESGWG